MTLLLVAYSHVFHDEVLGVSRLEHGVRVCIAVEGAADERDVLVGVARHAGGRRVVRARAEHVARAAARDGHAREVKGGVAVDIQASVERIVALRDLDGSAIGRVREVSRGVERALHRGREAAVFDGGSRHGDADSAGFLKAALRGKGRNRGGARQHERRHCRSCNSSQNFVHN